MSTHLGSGAKWNLNPGTTAYWMWGFENIVHLSELQSSHPWRILRSTLLFIVIVCLFLLLWGLESMKFLVYMWMCESTFDRFAYCHRSYLIASPWLVTCGWTASSVVSADPTVSSTREVFRELGDKAVLFWWVFSLCVMDHNVTRVDWSSWTHTLEPYFYFQWR